MGVKGDDVPGHENIKVSGTTFICKPCPVGTSQASGAALRCNPCPHGEYQDEEAMSSCKRCSQGTYQSLEGQSQCVTCPNKTTTLGYSSLDLSDYGCKDNKINMAPEGSGMFDCSPCGTGLHCDFPSTIQNLLDGPEDQTFARIRPGYFSTKDNPTSLYRCQPESYCTGGRPGDCAGGLIGVPCAVCPEGQTWNNTECAACAAPMVWAWSLGFPLLMIALFLMYYVGNVKVQAQATAMKLTTMALCLALNVLQTIALMGMMTVEWTTEMDATSSWLQFMTLDVSSLGISCVLASNPVILFSGTAMMIPFCSAWLFLCCLLTQFLPKKLQQWAWNWPNTVNINGILLQAGFSTVSAVILKPMMCYRHPNGMRSLLKYPNVICGESQQATMMAIALAVGSIFVVAFYVACCYAAFHMPQWSTNNNAVARLRACRFLFSNFRLNRWWFGLLTLARGFGFALVIVVATDTPAAQSSLTTTILVIYGFAQAIAWPWKASWINVTDMVLSALLLLLANRTKLKAVEVSPNDGPEWTFQRIFTFVILVGIGACLAFLTISSLWALSVQFLGIKTKRGSAGSLRKWDSVKLTSALKDCAEGLLAIEEQHLQGNMKTMNHYDLKALGNAISVIQNELIHDLSSRQSRLTKLGSARIKLHPSVDRLAPSAARTDTDRMSSTTSSLLTSPNNPVPEEFAARSTNIDAEEELETQDGAETFEDRERQAVGGQMVQTEL